MKILHKILLHVFSMACLVLSFCLFSLCFPIPYITFAISSYMSVAPWLNAVFTGFAALLCLFFLFLALLSLFYRGSSKDVILSKGRGALRISRQTVESTVKYSFSDVEGIGYCKISAKLRGKPEKTRIRIKLSFDSAEMLVGRLEDIQSRIETALSSSLGITAESINIEVAGVAGGNPVVPVVGQAVSAAEIAENTEPAASADSQAVSSVETI